MQYLTEKDLIELTELLHGYDWITDDNVLFPVYEKLKSTRLKNKTRTLEQQRIMLVQYYYSGAYKY